MNKGHDARRTPCHACRLNKLQRKALDDSPAADTHEDNTESTPPWRRLPYTLGMCPYRKTTTLVSASALLDIVV